MSGDASVLVSALPPGATEIIGRRRQMSEARKLLSQARLLTLTGVGGVGKTRLALRVAFDVRRAFPDGVRLVELAPVRAQELLIQTIGRSLGLQNQSARPTLETIADYLHDRRTLLILDNCEHLLDTCAITAHELLRASPGLRILATSREPLGGISETVLEVPPLSLPRDDEQSTLQEIAESEAVSLFINRAGLVDPGFRLSSQNSVPVAKLCKRLDGIPLAIELAARRLRALDIEQIVGRIDDRFHLLTCGPRTAPPRQQALRATLDWSFDLCSEREQILWARLSTFSGGFDLSAAEFVCNEPPIDTGDVLDLLAALVDKSVVTVQVRSGRNMRYTLLETLRQYGQDRLLERSEQGIMRKRHQLYFQSIAGQIRDDWFGPRQRDLFDLAAQDLSNFRIALDSYMCGPEDAAEGLKLASSLTGYWVFSGSFGEARYWFERVLQYLVVPRRGRFMAISRVAMFALLQGDLPAAQCRASECVDYAQRSPDASIRVIAECIAGWLALQSGHYEEAFDKFEMSVDYCLSFDARACEYVKQGDAFLVLFHLAISASLLSDDRSPVFAARCLELAENAHAPGETSHGLWINGFERWNAGDVNRASHFFNRCIHAFSSSNYQYCLPWGIESLAWVSIAAEDFERGARLFGIAQEMRSRMAISLDGFESCAKIHAECEIGARRHLGDKKFDDSLQLGAGLDFDEALSFARCDSKKSAVTPRTASANDTRLTPRQCQVAELIANGLSNKEIATHLIIAPRTAEAHVEQILVKLGFNSRTQIAVWVASGQDRP